MILLHPTAAATLVKAPILSGVLTLSSITVIGIASSLCFSLTTFRISSRSNVAEKYKSKC